eukprot:1143080-Pelagomonas_calceolata.AAC.5
MPAVVSKQSHCRIVHPYILHVAHPYLHTSCATLRWLIAIAYWLAGGFIKSGLGNRIAYAIVAAFGKTSLGLTYSLVFAEALLSPAIPSVAARAGGIFFPLAKVRLVVRTGAKPVQQGHIKSLMQHANVMRRLLTAGCGICPWVPLKWSPKNLRAIAAEA